MVLPFVGHKTHGEVSVWAYGPKHGNKVVASSTCIVPAPIASNWFGQHILLDRANHADIFEFRPGSMGKVTHVVAILTFCWKYSFVNRNISTCTSVSVIVKEFGLDSLIFVNSEELPVDSVSRIVSWDSAVEESIVVSSLEEVLHSVRFRFLEAPLQDRLGHQVQWEVTLISPMRLCRTHRLEGFIAVSRRVHKLHVRNKGS